MTAPLTHMPDPSLDLLLERVVDVPAEKVWECWTTPELMKQWFVPRPWTTPEIELDLRPGGVFHTVMQNPEGERFPDDGCILEVVPGRKLAWTSAMGPGYRPRTSGEGQKPGSLYFTAVITLEAVGPEQTRYSALVIHGDEESRKRHEDMGFYSGWSTVLDQLVTFIKGQAGA